MYKVRRRSTAGTRPLSRVQQTEFLVDQTHPDALDLYSEIVDAAAVDDDGASAEALAKALDEAASGEWKDLIESIDSGDDEYSDDDQARHQFERAREGLRYAAQLWRMAEEELRDTYKKTRAAADEAKRFFHRPSADARLDHWGRAAAWSLEEGVALCLGKEPAVVNQASLKPYLKESSFAQQFNDLLSLAERAARADDLKVTKGLNRTGDRTQEVLPGKFLKWAKDQGITCPSELAELVSSMGKKPAASEGGVETANASLLKLVAAMAFRKYGYDPRTKRHETATKAIIDDLTYSRIRLSDKSVRDWVREACETYLSTPLLRETFGGPE